MRQAIMLAPGVIEYSNIAEPGKIKDNEILLRIKKIGICGSDIHVYHGEHPAVQYPVVQGHEYSAVIEATGRNVTKAKPGMKATARPQMACGTCRPCRKGRYNICKQLKVQGFQSPGVAQDLFVVPEERLVILPALMTMEQGALVEPSAVGAHATGRAGDLRGKNVVISGAGTIGNLVAQFAKIRGAAKVLITDISDYRLKIAKKCGIEGVLNVSKTTFEKGVISFFGEEGFHVGFEAAGVQLSLDTLVSFVENGGDIIIIGVYAENPVINMYYVGEHELNVYGSMMYRQEDYEFAVEMITAGKIVTAPLITCSFPFEKFLDAYRYIDEKGHEIMKVMIDL
jgi:2-desacetyl-2-hydroxyethyl bacteriochlorophyllide A dehydrogenase